MPVVIIKSVLASLEQGLHYYYDEFCQTDCVMWIYLSHEIIIYNELMFEFGVNEPAVYLQLLQEQNLLFASPDWTLSIPTGS